MDYVELSFESLSSRRNVPDFHKVSLLAALPHFSSAQQLAGEQRREKEKKRKGSGNVLIKIFSPIFHTYVGGKEKRSFSFNLLAAQR